MKKHAIIPVFISHRGCPNNCVFCNQKRITARIGDVTPEDARNTIEQWLTTLRPAGGTAPEQGGVETVEVSFYGGSFTGIPLEEQTAFLKAAREYKDAGRIDMIHLSTRPDYIDRKILDNLRAYSVDVIELGVQSFDDKVLEASGRGHRAAAVYEAVKLIKEYGFTLGIQLMIGLPGDSMESCIFSANETVRLKPELARLYPTVTLRETELYEMYQRGEYVPMDGETAVERTKAMYEILDSAGINVIRVGLKSSEIMENELGFHPAFRQLVESRIARERLEAAIDEVIEQAVLDNPGIPSGTLEITCFANGHCYGNMFGHKGENREYFAHKYRNVKLYFEKDEGLKNNRYRACLRQPFTMPGEALAKLAGVKLK